MQADQTVLSLRPGGGNRGSRVLGPRFEPSSGFGSYSLSSDLPFLRPHGGAPSLSFKTGGSRFEGREHVRYTRDQLLQLREAGSIPEAILKIKQEVEAEFFGEDQNWGHVESSLQVQPLNRYSEPDNRDWRGRSAQFPISGDEKPWETIKENRDSGGWFDSKQQEAIQHNRQDQLSSQSGRAQISSNQGKPSRLTFIVDHPSLIVRQLPFLVQLVSSVVHPSSFDVGHLPCFDLSLFLFAIGIRDWFSFFAICVRDFGFFLVRDLSGRVLWLSSRFWFMTLLVAFSGSHGSRDFGFSGSIAVIL
ncbi:hypothetical protein U1Q18_018308 [Sarracenia purpurea var. burkii]